MLDKTFSPKDVETRLYEAWEKSGAFQPGRRPDAEPFCIMIPPPNITGRLHIGHALNNTLQDILARFERMRGKDVLWQPGTDHAGIATQLIVERQLAERQQNRMAMGREKFLEAVWKWKEESGGAIVEQLRRLGASADWSRERFTMDEGLSRAVTKVFVQLYNTKGPDGRQLIYKDKRLVNWDPRLQTAVSDLEVENIEIKGHLWHIRYPLADGVTYEFPVAFDEDSKPTEFETRDYIVVATTRPETMLGDTAVAVHPDNKKYKCLLDAKAHVRLPLTGRSIPIIPDEYADPEKGSGAVKITPGHDFNDFEVGKRHKLEIISVLDPYARINLGINAWDKERADRKFLDELHGVDRFEARKRIVAELEARGLVEKTESITHAVPHDEKTKTVVLEPYLTEQWYLNVTPLAEKAIAAVESGATKFVPENWAGVYFNWLCNIRPWCISRQLWWGHQIPVWYGPGVMGPDGQMSNVSCFAAETPQEACDQALKHYRTTGLPDGKPYAPNLETVTVDEIALLVPEAGMTDQSQIRHITIRRDRDVLDTWFSSALWPFSTLGWPDKTPELKKFYPTSVLVTGFDIIFFWVARMMMMGIHFMAEDRPDKAMEEIVPFKRVFIHTRVLDEQGAKMSKTKGNVVDPLTLIDEFGADALRFTLALAAGQNRDMRIGPMRVETNRNFGTKLWNASRFCEMNECVTQPGFDPEKVSLTINKWIVGEASWTANTVASELERLHFNGAAATAYHFVWDYFCDWYLEFAKPTFSHGDDQAKAETRATTAWVRDTILRILHPFMPFITEELWGRTSERDNLLIASDWPSTLQISDPEADSEMRWLMYLISNVRSVRSVMNVPASAKIPLLLINANAESKGRLNRNRELILTLARLDSIETSDVLPPASAQFVHEEATVALPLAGIIDFAKERIRLEKDLKKAQEEIARFDAKLSNEQFVSRAPEDVLTEQREKRAEAAALATRLTEAVARLAE